MNKFELLSVNKQTGETISLGDYDSLADARFFGADQHSYCNQKTLDIIQYDVIHWDANGDYIYTHYNVLES